MEGYLIPKPLSSVMDILIDIAVVILSIVTIVCVIKRK